MAAERMKIVEDRKARKPLLERKRRARINDSLVELKGIVLRSLNKDSSRYTKMEKADILEMAVKHLKALKETVNGYSKQDGSTQYRNGFTHCASEVSRYLMTMDSIDEASRSNILCHINNTCQSMHISIPQTSPPLSPLVPTIPQCTTHEDPCYHCRPLAYPPPHFLSHPTALSPRLGLMSRQHFGHRTVSINHHTSPQRSIFEKSLTKSLSDSSLMKMTPRAFSISSTLSQCSLSPTSQRTSESNTISTHTPATSSEPVWRPW